jgi:SAM-dependent methyltransferase
MAATVAVMDNAEQFWEPFYVEGRGRWSGRPNASLVDEVAELVPGRALDLGCGQGGDAIWLASRGWTVTAVDVSATALAVGERDAAAAGLADAIRWECHDLVDTVPPGPFDLVNAAFLHSPIDFPRGAVLRAAAAELAPGGALLIIGHMPSQAHPHADLPTPEAVIADLALPQDEWHLAVDELRTRRHAFADGEPVERVDSVLHFTRRAAAG